LNPFFEIRTLYFSTCATLFTLSACMVSYLLSRKTYPGFLSWTIGSALSFLAILLIGLRNILPDFISIIASNAFGILAMFLFYSGFKSFAGEKVKVNFHLSFIILYCVFLFPFFTYVAPNLRARIIIVSIANAIYFLLCGLVHYRQGQMGLIKLNKLLITTILILVSLRAFRAIYYFMPSSNTSNLMSAGVLPGVMILLLAVLSMTFIVSLMQLNSQKLEEERVKLINNLQRALDEIKTLKGIIPICSFCKKVRDDKGYWEQVDVYIYKHSDADISHSICPECLKKNYPEEYEEIYPDKDIE
jgi:hypothetical protein